jgi:hypothetical protein
VNEVPLGEGKREEKWVGVWPKVKVKMTSKVRRR